MNVPQVSHPAATRFRAGLWLALCVGSLAWYLLHAQAIPAFLHEVGRLWAKL